MKRMFLGFRLALESIFGVLILGTSLWSIVQFLQSHLLRTSTLIGLAVGTLLVWDALRMRKVMNRLDEQSSNEPA